MYAQYGSYQFTANTVEMTMSQQRRYSQRGKHFSTVKTATCDGFLAPSSPTQANIKTAIANLEAAMVDGKDFGFYHDNGTLSAHSLPNASSISGVRVKELSYPVGSGADYATERKFRVVFEAEYAASTGDQIIAWQERLTFIGDCGPLWVYQPLIVGPPDRQMINQRTTQTVLQSGGAVGYLSRPQAGPILFPAYEHTDQRRVELVAPTFDGGKFTNYGITWNYVYESHIPLNAVPTAK